MRWIAKFCLGQYNKFDNRTFGNPFKCLKCAIYFSFLYLCIFTVKKSFIYVRMQKGNKLYIKTLTIYVY